MLNEHMYLLVDGRKFYIEQRDGWWTWVDDDGRRFVISDAKGVPLPGVEIYDGKLAPPPTCNVCGERPAEYRVTEYHDHGNVRPTTNSSSTTSYSCHECLVNWWRLAIDAHERMFLFNISVSPIKDYGYRCDHHSDTAASDVLVQYILGQDERPPAGKMRYEWLCPSCALLERATLSVCGPRTGVFQESLHPIEDFLMEGTRWPGK